MDSGSFKKCSWRRLATHGLASLVLLWGLACANAAITFTATLDRDTTTVGESVTLQLIFQGNTSKPMPMMPRLPQFQVQYGGESSQFTFANGQTSSTLTYTYSLTPTQAGDLTIPSIQAQVDGQMLSSQSLKLKVLPSGTTPGNTGNPAPKIAFLRIGAQKNELYIGEVLPVEVQLYFQNARDYQPIQLNAEGFTIGKLIGPATTRAQIGLQSYNLYIFKTAVAAVRAGNLALGPAECTINLIVALTQPNRPRSPFDSFFDDPFFGGVRSQLRPVTLTSDPLKIRVLPLPTNDVPANFNGAVGSYTLNVQASPTNVAVGDPITVKVQVSGHGALDSLTLPAIEEGKLFKVYPPVCKVESSSPLNVDGTKTFEYVMTPQAAEAKTLPPIQFSFFDPEQKSYRTLQPAPIPLIVRPATMASLPPGPASSPGANRETPPVTPDLLNIKTHLGTVTAPQAALVQRPWFAALQAIPLLVWLGAVVRRRYVEALSRNPRRRRQQQVARLIDSGLKELRQYAEANEAELFYATAFRLLQEQLGERLDLPASAITEAVLDEHLRPHGVPEETLTLLHDVFQRCNQARYAPRQISEGLFFQFPKIEAAILSLKQLAVVLVGLLAFALTGWGAENWSSDFDQANKLYAEGKFAEAATLYKKIVQAGKISASLYFNLGNAYFKAGQTGLAIANYRLAQQLSPRDPDLRANLQFVRNRLNGGSLSRSQRWLERLNWLTLNEWTGLCAVLLWLWFGALTVEVLIPDLKKSLKNYTVAMGILTGFILVCLALRCYAEFGRTQAVITAREATVKYGPLEESRPFYTLTDGAEVTILDQEANWLQVRDANQRTGWVKRNQAFILTIRPASEH